MLMLGDKYVLYSNMKPLGQRRYLGGRQPGCNGGGGPT